MDKAQFRKQLIDKRALMDKNEWGSKSDLIINHIISSLLYKKSETIHVFVSMNDRYEVNTHPLIKKMLSEQKNVIVPITNFESSSLSHVKLEKFEHLTPNKWGVLEPESDNTVNPDSIDLVLVPLLAADRMGNRIGYGKGFYDRFLQNLNADTYGLVFDEFILDHIPVEQHDQQLTGLISESGIIHCNKERTTS